MINIRLDAASVAYILEHAETRLLIVHPSCKETAERAMREHGPRLSAVWLEEEGLAAPASPGFSEFLAGATLLETSAIVDEWQPICLNYTSGTTGRPKGVVLHHRGAFLRALGNLLALGLSERSRYLWVLPMFHCNGWSHTWGAVTAAGGTHICLQRVDAAEILRVTEALGVTHLCCAPVVLYMLTAEPGFSDLRLSSPLTIATGGASPTARLIADLEQKGISMIHLYGLTESYGPNPVCRRGGTAFAIDRGASCLVARRTPSCCRRGSGGR